MGRPPIIDRTELLAAARRQFARKGFERTTLADIAAELHVTAAAVLRHAGSKEKLFLQAMRAGVTELPPFIAAVENAPADADPREILGSFARAFVPFAEKSISGHIAVYMHSRSAPLTLPFDVNSPDSPPRRGVAALEAYMRRATEAGRMRARDPRAAALLFAGQLQAYVFLHHILRIAPTPHPFDQYLDQLLELWTSGVIVPAAAPRRAAKTRGGSSGPRKR
jgi:AcrR family transcriptional regulator